ncbi:MAG: transglycosylase SLT domain-containing protein [Candidatus Pacearchaeota archaeon]
MRLPNKNSIFKTIIAALIFSLPCNFYEKLEKNKKQTYSVCLEQRLDQKFDYLSSTYNEKVAKWEDFYSNTRDFYNALKRIEKRISSYNDQFEQLSKDFANKIEKIREKYHEIDLFHLLTAIEIVESYGNPNCVSKAGAIGPYQLMPENIKEHKITEDKAKNPLVARKICFKDIVKYYEMFQNTETPLEFALAAYNWGPSRVKKAIERTNCNNWWELINLAKKIPKETRNYVPKVLAVYNLLKYETIALIN